MSTSFKFRVSLTDIYSRLFFPNFPYKQYETLFISPDLIKHALPFTPSGIDILSNSLSFDIDNLKFPFYKFICGGSWSDTNFDICEVSPYSRALNHFKYGLSWEEVGEIDWMMLHIEKNGVQDGCKNYSDVLNRCSTLDDIFLEISKTRIMLPQYDIYPSNFRGLGGIGVALDKNSNFVWVSQGLHRLAIAHSLSLPQIPVTLCLVHTDARDYLKK